MNALLLRLALISTLVISGSSTSSAQAPQPASAHQFINDVLPINDVLRELVETRSDLDGVYLETATEANVAYYTRHGYEAIGEFYPLGVRMWRMFQSRRDR